MKPHRKNRSGRTNRGGLKTPAWWPLLLASAILGAVAQAASPVGGLLDLPEEPPTGPLVSLGDDGSFDPLETWSQGRPLVIVEDASLSVLERDLEGANMGTSWGNPLLVGVLAGGGVLVLGVLALGSTGMRRSYR